MRRIKCLVSVLSVILVITCNRGLIVNAAADENSVSDYVEEFCNDTKCNSVSVAVYTDGTASFYGDADGLYQIGSMTKAFTGLGVQKLISEGKIDPQSTVSEFIPGFEAYFDKVQYEITVGQLLSQTSGYSNSESLYPGADDDMTLQDWAHSISGKELQSIPGEKYSYSNVNYNLLGAIIERVSGESYKVYMEREILIPLGLTNTFISVDPDDENIIPGSRIGYRHAFRYEIKVTEGRIPAGYIYSNARDMARWMEIWLGTADIPDEYKEIVGAVKTHLNEEGEYYSGWEVFGKETIGHSGGTPNYSSRMVFDKKGRTGVLVLTNLNVAASTDSLCNGIYSYVSNGDKAGIATDVWTVFDIIFSIASVTGVLLAVAAFCIRRRKALIIMGIAISLLVISICISLPLIFGAGLGDIMFVWAPYSFAGALVLLTVDILLFGIRFWMLNKNADRKKIS